MKYYIVTTEWNYPTESGRDVHEDFDSYYEALECCNNLCKEELDNYEQVCGDAFGHAPLSNEDYMILQPANGLDDYHFLARVLTVESIH